MYYDVLDKEVEQKLDEYEEVFPEGFPLAQFEGTKKELINEIEECIKTNKEYDTSFWDEHPDYDDQENIMNDFETIQEILKRNEIEFLINEDCNDDDLEDFNIITLREGMKNIEAYSWFLTWLFFDKKNGKLKKVGIYE